MFFLVRANMIVAHGGTAHPFKVPQIYSYMRAEWHFLITNSVQILKNEKWEVFSGQRITKSWESSPWNALSNMSLPNIFTIIHFTKFNKWNLLLTHNEVLKNIF